MIGYHLRHRLGSGGTDKNPCENKDHAENCDFYNEAKGIIYSTVGISQ